MGIDIDWLEGNQGAHRKFVGNVSFNDLINSTLELQDNPNFDSFHYLIEDYTNATNIPFKSSEVEPFCNFVRMRGNTRKALKVAIISRNFADNIAVAQAFCAKINQTHYQSEVFLNVSDAKAWVVEAS